MLPRRRRAWASWNYHLLAEPKAATHGHLPHEPPAVAARRARVLRDAQPHRGDRSRLGSSARSPTRIRCTRTAGCRRRRGSHEIRRAQPHALLRRVLGLGVPRGRRGERAARRPSASEHGCERELHLRGHDSPPALASRGASSRHRLALAYIDLDELPRLLGGRLVARVPGLVRFRRRDYLGDPARAARPRGARAVQRARPASGPAGPIRVLTQLRSFGHCFNPVSFYYCFDPAGERVRGGGRGGDEHALGGAARLRAAAGAGLAACSRRSSRRRCTCRRSWAWITATTRGRPRRAGRCRSTSTRAARATRRVRRDARRCAAGS